MEEICSDTFCIIKKGSEPSIKFTMESEEDSKLPFLDCLLKRDSYGMLTSTVYRKPTHR